MSIPKWREVEDTDDGCRVYQCLNCYNLWEGRTNPEWNKWRFCPYCGLLWEGKHDCKTKQEQRYDLLDKYGEFKFKNSESYWRLEERYSYAIQGQEYVGKWKPVRTLQYALIGKRLGQFPDEWTNSSRLVLASLKRLRSGEEYNDWGEADDDVLSWDKYDYRAVIVSCDRPNLPR